MSKVVEESFELKLRYFSWRDRNAVRVSA